MSEINSISNACNFSAFTLLGKAKKAKKSCRKPEGKENISKKDKEIAISAQHDELVITQILQSSTSSDPVPEHPHFGGKQPKLHKPPKCISVLCREEKDALTNKLEDVTKTLQDTQAKLERMQEELSKCNHLVTITLKILHSSIGVPFKNLKLKMLAFVWQYLEPKYKEEN